MSREPPKGYVGRYFYDHDPFIKAVWDLAEEERLKLNPRGEKISPKLTMEPPFRASLAPKDDGKLVQLVVTKTAEGRFRLVRFSPATVISSAEYEDAATVLMHFSEGLKDLSAS